MSFPPHPLLPALFGAPPDVVRGAGVSRYGVEVVFSSADRAEHPNRLREGQSRVNTPRGVLTTPRKTNNFNKIHTTSCTHFGARLSYSRNTSPVLGEGSHLTMRSSCFIGCLTSADPPQAASPWVPRLYFHFIRSFSTKYKTLAIGSATSSLFVCVNIVARMCQAARI